MRVEALLFGVYLVFLVIVAGIYWIFSEEWVGTVCLLLSGLLGGLVGGYLWFTGRRIDVRPEDRTDALIEEGAGEVGFFAPHSWWPIALGAAASITFLGLLFPWLGLIGLVAVLIGVSGLLFEYYVGINRSQGHTLGELAAMGEQPTSVHKFLGE